MEDHNQVDLAIADRREQLAESGEIQIVATGNETPIAPHTAEELNAQFMEFLHTKGICAKFKLAFENMGESARRQREIDRANFAASHAQAARSNQEFIEFLHTKGVKAKARLVLDNVKKGMAEASAQHAPQLAGSAETPLLTAEETPLLPVNAQTLALAFNEFLRIKGLGEQYTVEVTEE